MPIKPLDLPTMQQTLRGDLALLAALVQRGIDEQMLLRADMRRMGDLADNILARLEILERTVSLQTSNPGG
jgi:hypothetical protein